MKYLNSYKLFESYRQDKIREDIKDIFQSEVDNDDFSLLDWANVGRENFGFKVQKRSQVDFPVVEPFQVMELADFIERLLDYSDISPCEIEVYVPLPVGVEFITKRDLVEARNSKIGFFSDYSAHTVIIKVRVFE